MVKDFFGLPFFTDIDTDFSGNILRVFPRDHHPDYAIYEDYYMHKKTDVLPVMVLNR